MNNNEILSRSSYTPRPTNCFWYHGILGKIINRVLGTMKQQAESKQPVSQSVSLSVRPRSECTLSYREHFACNALTSATSRRQLLKHY